MDELIKIKDQIIKKRQTPPQYIKADLKTFDLTTLGKFDVILMDPPWEEYSRRSHGYSIESSEKMTPWSFQEIAALNIEALAELPSFLFLWVGESENLEVGRELFRLWGYKRCEDIVWVKTNKVQKYKSLDSSKNSLLQRVKEHCLVGVRGDVRRASDSHFINANIDTDVIVEEEPPLGSLKKPEEIYNIIERFCLGRKRIELFGEISSIREGWLCVGNDLPDTNYNITEYNSWFEGDVSYPIVQDYKGGRYLGTTLEVENLRPKSPNRANANVSNMTGGSFEGRSASAGGGKVYNNSVMMSAPDEFPEADLRD